MDLPNIVILEIVRHLSLKEIFNAMVLLCKRYNRLISNNLRSVLLSLNNSFFASIYLPTSSKRLEDIIYHCGNAIRKLSLSGISIATYWKALQKCFSLEIFSCEDLIDCHSENQGNGRKFDCVKNEFPYNKCYELHAPFEFHNFTDKDLALTIQCSTRLATLNLSYCKEITSNGAGMHFHGKNFVCLCSTSTSAAERHL